VSSTPLSREKLQEMLLRSAFVEFMGLQIVTADPEKQEIVMHMGMRPEFERGQRGSGQWHGGALAAVIDTVGDYALTMMIGGPLPTINFRVDYLRPAVNTALTISARVRRSGKTVGVVDVDVMTESGALVAIGRANYSTMTS
jgi:uncharacterized protein (TIGR00369 family)